MTHGLAHTADRRPSTTIDDESATAARAAARGTLDLPSLTSTGGTLGADV
jgi:hypothetical protein